MSNFDAGRSTVEMFFLFFFFFQSARWNVWMWLISEKWIGYTIQCQLQGDMIGIAPTKQGCFDW